MNEILNILMTTVDPLDYETLEEYYKESVEICFAQFGECPDNLKEFTKEEWENRNEE